MNSTSPTRTTARTRTRAAVLLTGAALAASALSGCSSAMGPWGADSAAAACSSAKSDAGAPWHLGDKEMHGKPIKPSKADRVAEIKERIQDKADRIERQAAAEDQTPRQLDTHWTKDRIEGQPCTTKIKPFDLPQQTPEPTPAPSFDFKDDSGQRDMSPGGYRPPPIRPDVPLSPGALDLPHK